MAENLKELRLLNIGGVDYNVGFSANDLTDALKLAYDKAVTDSANALVAFEGLTIAKITADLEANVREAYQLHDKDGNALGETIKVYKDSALQDVELVNQKLTFTYNLADGTSKTEEVDLSLFLAQAEFKNGLAVNEDGEVNVALGTSGTDKGTKNFLELEGSVDGEKVLAVRDMDANVTVTTAEIPVNGGPLATMYKNAGLGSTIAAGTDLQALLMNLFCKESYPTISESAASLVSTVGTPTITLGNTNTVEVGTSVDVTIKNGASSYTANPHKVTGMTNGYSEADDDSKDSSNTSIQSAYYTVTESADKSVKISGDNKVTMTYTLNGTSATEEGTAVAESAVVETSVNAIEGDYTITAKATSVKYTGVCKKLDSVYYCSNLGNTDAAKKTTAREEVTKTSSVVTSSTASKNVVGAYKWYIGSASAVPTDTAGIKALTAIDGWDANNGFITKDSGNSFTTGGWQPGGSQFVIAVPSTYKVSLVENGLLVNEIEKSFVKSTVTYNLPNGSVTYNVYAHASGVDWEFKKITIAKA